jgi:hypothetical protein
MKRCQVNVLELRVQPRRDDRDRTASVFHANGKTGVAEIEDAYSLLSPLLAALPRR